MLLESTGELVGHGLECDNCSPYDKGIRGCGTAPRVPDWDGVSTYFSGRERPWTARYWLELCEKTQTVDPADLAEQLWPYANIGDAIDVTGSPWPCCPAWFARFSSDGGRQAAFRAFQLLDWREDGALASIDDGPLLEWQVDLIGVAKRARGAHQMRRIEAGRKSED